MTPAVAEVLRFVFAQRAPHIGYDADVAFEFAAKDKRHGLGLDVAVIESIASDAEQLALLKAAH
jgi:hypothetical protein